MARCAWARTRSSSTPGTRAREIYGEAVIYERHRHRYEVNNFLRKRIEAAGLVCSGTSPDERLVEIIEIPDHPFFVASQYHPEFKSRPERPAPLFRDFVAAALRPRRGAAPARARRRGAGRRAVRPASEAEKARLNDSFVDLCRILSPSGEEAACAEHVERELRGMGLQVERDEAGNLLARLRGRGERTILLCAHLDTVPARAPVDPVLVDGAWENANDGILGADNKAAVAMLLELARRCSVEGSPVGVELVFTVQEEVGLLGAKRVRRVAAGGRVRLRVRPRDGDRRDRHRRADALPDRGRVPRQAGPRGHPPGGRSLGDPRRRPRGRGDAARPHRR